MEQYKRPPNYYNSRTRTKRKKKKLNKKRVILVILLFFLIISFFKKKDKKKEIEVIAQENNDLSNSTEIIAESNNDINNDENNNNNIEKPKKEITDWRLKLANYENLLPEDFTVELEDIDENRQFDARAIKELKQMMKDMKKDGITNIWVQSAYRSVKKQKELYNNSIKKYIEEGKTQKEAEELTIKFINKPGSSDHNLGLAVDFNYVNVDFEKMKGYKWLLKNAEDYGFILRYPKDKESITKISYEPWHWRYVGKEHAKKMNELNMCLEEYIEYLENQE